MFGGGGGRFLFPILKRDKNSCCPNKFEGRGDRKRRNLPKYDGEWKPFLDPRVTIVGELMGGNSSTSPGDTMLEGVATNYLAVGLCMKAEETSSLTSTQSAHQNQDMQVNPCRQNRYRIYTVLEDLIKE